MNFITTFFGHLFIWIILGIPIGLLRAWNRKVYNIFFLVLVGIVVITVLAVGADTATAEMAVNLDWTLIADIVGITIGGEIGESIWEELQ